MEMFVNVCLTNRQIKYTCKLARFNYGLQAFYIQFHDFCYVVFSSYKNLIVYMVINYMANMQLNSRRLVGFSFALYLKLKLIFFQGKLQRRLKHERIQTWIFMQIGQIDQIDNYSFDIYNFIGDFWLLSSFDSQRSFNQKQRSLLSHIGSMTF